MVQRVFGDTLFAVETLTAWRLQPADSLMPAVMCRLCVEVEPSWPT